MRIATLAGVAGLMAFPLLVFPLIRALPFGGELPDDLAASVLGVDRWTAGAGLMSRADPGRWSDFVQGYAAAHAAGDDLKICFDAAKKAGRGQRCTITVDPISPGHRDRSNERCFTSGTSRRTNLFRYADAVSSGSLSSKSASERVNEVNVAQPKLAVTVRKPTDATTLTAW